MNVKDIPAVEHRLAVDYKSSAQFETILKKYTGPGVGLVWDDKTMKLSIASGWHVDEDGEIVRDFD